MSADASAMNLSGPRVDMGDFADYSHDSYLTDVEPGEHALTATWSDGFQTRFHYIWLRDHCACGACRHPQTRERMVRVIDLPAELPAPVPAVTSTGVLHLSWPAMAGFAPHESLFDPGWLRRRAGDHATTGEIEPTPWDARFAPDLPIVAHDAFMSTDAALVDWLRALERYGLVLMRGGPAEPGEILRVAGRIGWARETNFGRVFDVMTKPDPNNAAFTAIALEPHADLPNWQRPPDFQMLYCIANDAEGGASVFTDGFSAAEMLRAEDPDGFRLLAEQPIDFRFHDEVSDIVTRAPLIGLDDQGRPREIRFNNWIRDTLRIPETCVEAFYRAYRRLWELLRDPEHTVRLHLGPGEMVAFDNLRVLHGRDAFDPGTGHRHLQGSYLDRDLVRSRLRVLERTGA